MNPDPYTPKPMDAAPTAREGHEGRLDGPPAGEADGPVGASDANQRILVALEGERALLAQEVHDGPAQALSNAIFQIDYIERVLDDDPRAAHTELRFLRELLRRELGDVRAFITQLRPPVLDELGLDGAIDEAVDLLRTVTGASVTVNLTAPADALADGARTVVLRVTQEALQNVRKHAAATNVSVNSRLADGSWTLEVRDDGRGFDVEGMTARSRRNFGLQFMRERAELIGARLDLRSRTGDGTVVRLAIPIGAGTGVQEDR